ncbi:hypothetical protein ACFWEN_40730, partial [Streptomyces anthocyanicus]
MYRSTTRRGVSTAITTVLAVTLGAGVLSVPAAAAPLPAAVTAGTGTQAAPVAFPVHGYLAAAGQSGFLSYALVDRVWTYQWTRYADGSTTKLADPVADATGTDVIMTGRGQNLTRSLKVTLHDMAAGGSTVTIDLGPLSGTYVKAVSANSVLAQMKRADGSPE